jgi:6-phosphogluconolactonase (cycloisomerase 2 family)
MDRGRARPDFEIETTGGSIQNLSPAGSSHRFEGVAFSSCGNILGVATSDTDTVSLFRRKPDGRFEAAPYRTIHGPGSGLDYPHDLSFCASGGTELLAIVQRPGSIAVYAGARTSGDFGARPAFELRGAATRMDYSDGVAFVPPEGDYLAVCNGQARSSITFYRKARGNPIAFEPEPVFELKHRATYSPDGLGFSRCGTWLAAANHGNHTVSVFRRRRGLLNAGRLRYGPDPVAVIQDPELRYPHSVAFTPLTHHLVVSSAGANHFSVYRPRKLARGMEWLQAPVLRHTFAAEDVFNAAHAHNGMEGGPKGIAIYGNTMAVCSPECGVNVYSFREAAG